MKLRHRETGVETELSAGMEVGRLSSCGLRVADGSVSRRHAQVELRGGEWWLVDLGSSNGSKRNGRKEKEFPLRSGDLVMIGAVAFEVVGPPPAAAPSAPAAAAAASRAVAAEAPATASAPARPDTRLPKDRDKDLEQARATRETEAERARIHAELRAKRRSGGFGDLNQLSFRMQLLVGLLGLVFLVVVAYGVRWLGDAM